MALDGPAGPSRSERSGQIAPHGAILARPVMGAAMRDLTLGVAFWAYPRAWATAEVRVGAGVGESQV